jgi:hypothetical protein
MTEFKIIVRSRWEKLIYLSRHIIQPRDSFFNLLLILFSFVQWTSPKVHARNITLSYQWWGEGDRRSSWIKIKVWDGDE